jgi:hypothetical protein
VQSGGASGKAVEECVVDRVAGLLAEVVLVVSLRGLGEAWICGGVEVLSVDPVAGVGGELADERALGATDGGRLQDAELSVRVGEPAAVRDGEVIAAPRGAAGNVTGRASVAGRADRSARVEPSDG